MNVSQLEEPVHLEPANRELLGLNSDDLPLRRELFSLDLLQQHARHLASQHQVIDGKGHNLLLPRLRANEKLLREYNEATLLADKKRRVTPAGEWLLDNFHLIEEQVRTARRHLPRSFSRQLPHLGDGQAANYPRVYELALELISHLDGHVDAVHLSGFVAAYQEVSQLKLGELWAFPIMLRLALIENLRRIAALLSTDRKERDLADEWIEEMVRTTEKDSSKLIEVVGKMAQTRPGLSQAFVAEFWRRVQEKSPTLKLALSWIEERLGEQGLSIHELVQAESKSQAANQVSVGNSIGSLRFLDAMDWREFVETQSVVEQTLRLDPAQIYPRMDFATRDNYRHVVENLARHSKQSELTVATTAIELAQRHITNDNPRFAHVGYFLLGKGLEQLEEIVQAQHSLTVQVKRLGGKYPLACYSTGIVGLTILCSYGILAWMDKVGSLSSQVLWWLSLLLALCTSQLAVSVVNWFVTVFVPPRQMSRMDFSEGIPSEHATMVVVPTLLGSVSGINSLIESIEIHYLANRDPNVFFGLLTDFRDAPQEHLPQDDELLKHAVRGIEALNRKYRLDRPQIFFLFHRPRKWNAHDGVWMGYERKRGKLADLNRYLRGSGRESFSQVIGEVARLPRIQYVITLDTDTQLPREAAQQLAATMAHPLNRPQYDAERGTVVEGYSILQPRVAVSLPSANKSRFVKLFSGDPGLDPYTRAVSDVYQDAFEEGSFIGKGIYDVDAFEQAVGGKFPENRILSHDLLEGSYARSALVTDVQLYEDFPERYSTDTKRRHRWIRGDWQIATWLLPRLPGTDVRQIKNPLSNLSQWKIFDNLRRSLVPPSLMLLFVIGWVLLPGYGAQWSTLMVGLIAFPHLLSAGLDVIRKSKGTPVGIHLHNCLTKVAKHFSQALLTLSFLAYDAWISLDAIIRTLFRLFLSHRNLLEWQTSSDAEQQSGNDLGCFVRTMWYAPASAAIVGIILYSVGFTQWTTALPLLVLWVMAPAVAWWISLPLPEKAHELSPNQTSALHTLARKTWRFFETFVGPEDNWLPPDNYQENPRPVIATRTSPTNIGMYMLCTLSAHDFGYLTQAELIDRLGQTVNTLNKLERYEGHFYNWYDTRSLVPLSPLYISTVDNGNLTGLLFTLQAGLVELTETSLDIDAAMSGLRDTVQTWLDQVSQPVEKGRISTSPQTISRLKELRKSLNVSGLTLSAYKDLLNGLAQSTADFASLSEYQVDAEFTWWQKALTRTIEAQLAELNDCYPCLRLEAPIQQFLATGKWAQLERLWQELTTLQSLRALAKNASSRATIIDAHLPLIQQDPDARALLLEFKQALLSVARNAELRLTTLHRLAAECEQLARMDFKFLYNPSRELLSIGYNVQQQRLDASCYDLLASEARLASFTAIALGQLPQHHWFTLGRLLTMTKGDPTLISWSGSMFEYLMPMLVMPSYESTLIDLSCRAAVTRQIEYGRQMSVPWGISESGYNLRDADANYQYRAFGVPGLGFKRGLAEDLVIAPYATVMSLMVAPLESCQNLDRLRQYGSEGAYGFYEALDFTTSRVPRGQESAVVQSFMAHHQGMSLLALAYTLHDRPMQRRFNSNPSFKSTELLLHERVPNESPVLYPHELEAESSREISSTKEVTLRVFKEPNISAPEVHLLSNNRYHVVITNCGGGYSHWQGTALTRWRDDVTRDCWGTFLYLRDRENGEYWSAAYQPALVANSTYEAIFSQGRAEFRARVLDIESHVEISVSPEDDVEIRRITLTNRSYRTRTLELTSYAEIVLNGMNADLAHPAFSNLFVQTKILRTEHGVLCTRRARSAKENPPVMFHLLLLEGEEVGRASFETDRSRFIGRGQNTFAPSALMSDDALSDSEGSVLDPVIAIRRTVQLAPKEHAQFKLVSGIAADLTTLQALIAKYQDQMMCDRCFELAWTHGLVMLRHLNITEANAQLYSRLAGALLYGQGTLRAAPEVIRRNRKGQRDLWSFGISGDLPIILVRSRSMNQMDLIRDVVQAHAYWRMKGLTADLVILTEVDSVYRQSLHDQIMSFLAGTNAAQIFEKPGGIFTRRLDQLAADDVALLETASRIVLSDDKGSLTKQLERTSRPAPLPARLISKTRRTDYPTPELPQRELVFFNGLGGFTPDGKEYVIALKPENVTPAPWVNVIANPMFGTVISESGAGYSWSENCHEFRLTPWSNDPISDISGEAFYLRDENSGYYWSPTPQPSRGKTPYTVRHGFGYSVFEHIEEGISTELWFYVAMDAPVKFAKVKVKNLSHQTRQLSLTGYWEWVLGEFRHKNAAHIATEFSTAANALLARNPYNTDFANRTAFVTCSEPVRSFTGDRSEFIGRNNSSAFPAAMERVRLAGRVGVALDPCAALQINLTLAPNQEKEVVFLMGCGRDNAHALQLAQSFQSREASQKALAAVWDYWNRTLGTVYVETPDPALNILANGWLLYQVMSCRLWARTGLYQSGGAFGFRDQLQDSMALVHAEPRLLREQILRAAAHQFPEGDVQHWWHPPHDRGVRTHFSDDYLWLPYGICRYVENTGDIGVLEEEVHFIEGRALRPEEEAYYDTPQRSPEKASLYEHAKRAITHGLKFGEHGLPLIGCGDWNDGMNMIGEQGKGESVWLAFFLYDVLQHFRFIARLKNDADFEKLCAEEAQKLIANIEQHAWDGQWYRRAYFDNGEPLGSHTNPECQIDALPQSWAVITGAGQPERCRTALDAVQHRLVRREAGLIQLFDPPFDKSHLEPGYIKGYVPGVRENGGQYTHAAIWTVMAFALNGDLTRAWEFFSLINPILHADTPEKAARYKVEPYVIAADVYSVPPHTGRGGWTWYTGSAGWMYRLITETLLGLTLEVDKLRFDPRVPPTWKEFTIHYRYRNTVYHLRLVSQTSRWNALPTITLDGRAQPDHWLPLVDDRHDHHAVLSFG